jgi:lipoprotein Spr
MLPAEGEVVRRARLALGAAFRPHGRTIGEGMDCVGLAAFALGIDRQAVPSAYALRSGDASSLARELRRLCLMPVHSADELPGDVAVFAVGPGQLHLAIVTASTLIHADASLRRIVERPLPPPWPLLARWRLHSKDGSD